MIVKNVIVKTYFFSTFILYFVLVSIKFYSRRETERETHIRRNDKGVYNKDAVAVIKASAFQEAPF